MPNHACLHCSNLTKNPKFCSRSCAASFNNHTPKVTAKPKYCKSCKDPLNQVGYSQYCDTCKLSGANPIYRDWTTVSLGDLRKGRPTYQLHAHIRQLARRVYRRISKPQHCAVCDYKNHFEVCHIKPISSFDDDVLISEINSPSNLVGLCPNCHWDFDNGLFNLSLLSQKL